MIVFALCIRLNLSSILLGCLLSLPRLDCGKLSRIMEIFRGFALIDTYAGQSPQRVVLVGTSPLVVRPFLWIGLAIFTQKLFQEIKNTRSKYPNLNECGRVFSHCQVNVERRFLSLLYSVKSSSKLDKLLYVSNTIKIRVFIFFKKSVKN